MCPSSRKDYKKYINFLLIDVDLLGVVDCELLRNMKCIE